MIYYINESMQINDYAQNILNDIDLIYRDCIKESSYINESSIKDSLIKIIEKFKIFVNKIIDKIKKFIINNKIDNLIKKISIMDNDYEIIIIKDINILKYIDFDTILYKDSASIDSDLINGKISLSEAKDKINNIINKSIQHDVEIEGLNQIINNLKTAKFALNDIISYKNNIMNKYKSEFRTI